MTIKQQGGVFGRNPTFNDVTVDGDLAVTDGNVSGTLSFPDNAQARFGNSNDLLIYHNGGNSLILDNGAGDLVLGCQNFRLLSNSLAKNLIRGFVDGAIEIYHNNDLSFSSGVNGVVIPDGKGIDFSATSGTGTSELFDDYEEGTWTPAYTTTSTDFDAVTYNFQSGEYIKIGRMVWCSFQFRTSSVTIGSASGNLRISGLPFTVAGSAAADAFGPVGTYKSFASGNPQVVSPVNGTTQMQVLSHDFVIQPYSIIATGADANWLNGNITYISSI